MVSNFRFFYNVSQSILHQKCLIFVKDDYFTWTFSFKNRDVNGVVPLAETEVNAHLCDWLMHRSIYMPSLSVLYTRWLVLWHVFEPHSDPVRRNWNKAITTIATVCVIMVITFACLIAELYSIKSIIINCHVTKDATCMRVCTDFISSTQLYA